MAYLLSEHFPDGSSGETDWTTAGASSTEGAAICADFAARFADRPGGPEFAESHESKLLTAEHVDAADLILTATVAERGTVSLLRPTARSRAFTLLEAASLAEHAVSIGARTNGGGLVSVAAVLNAQRGRFDPPQPRVRRWRRASTVRPYDVPDAHTSSATHDRVIADIEAGAVRLTRALRALGVGTV